MSEKEEKGKFHSLTLPRRQMTRSNAMTERGASFSLDKSGNDDDEGGRGRGELLLACRGQLICPVEKLHAVVLQLL